ncbi:LITAF domain-containing protein-like [Paramacrobiotus metropolitanus]|uniref:LITAF domain-containing protein-like n=1 Tax=Paramacrobiotus metropolitanus TaxID=2943436 RepID=UPI00244637C5|nr:LITAF domain-containing protein-like [Paramacrobiotus metropolitanus]
MEKSELSPPPYSSGESSIPTIPIPVLDQPRTIPVQMAPPAYAQTVFVPVHAAPVTAVGFPVPAICPRCNQSVTTRVEYESGALTWILVGALAFVGCIFGCCLIPFCIDSCKDAVHSCPNCQHYFGKYRRL